MRELRFEGVNDDGTALVLVDDANQEEFEVAVDKRLLSSLALARVKVPAPTPTPTAQALADSGELSPAEIQARLRMGHAPEEIAEQTGTDLARVLRYQDPIINERAWVAERAAAVKLRKGNEQVALGEVVTSRLAAISDRDVSVTWDAWRREDGLWLVRVTYETATGEREAHWLFDAAISSIAPHGAEAEWLMELDPPETAKASTPRRLVSVPTPQQEAADDGFFDGEAVETTEATAFTESGEDVADATTEIERETDLESDADSDIAIDEFEEQVEETGTERGRPSIPTWDEILFGTPTRPRD